MDKEEEMRLLKIELSDVNQAISLKRSLTEAKAELYKDYVNPRYHVDIKSLYKLRDELESHIKLLKDDNFSTVEYDETTEHYLRSVKALMEVMLGERDVESIKSKNGSYFGSDLDVLRRYKRGQRMARQIISKVYGVTL